MGWGTPSGGLWLFLALWLLIVIIIIYIVFFEMSVCELACIVVFFLMYVVLFFSRVLVFNQPACWLAHPMEIICWSFSWNTFYFTLLLMLDIRRWHFPWFKIMLLASNHRIADAVSPSKFLITFDISISQE